MAQVLKDDWRKRIIEAAKEEFLEYGYEDASMRRIAQKADMTVGNLYRYFKNKEDINIQIVGPTYEKLNEAIKKTTSNKLSFDTRVYNMRLNIKSLRDDLDFLAEELVDIYEEDPVEFTILMLHSNLNERLNVWFSGVIKNLIMRSYTIEAHEHACDLLSKTFAVSVFSGVRELFRINDVDNQELKRLLKIYFRTYVYTLDTDINIYLGEND